MRFTQGYQYLSETRYGEVEPLLDKLRRAAEGMGMPVRSVEIEMGPSQFEFTFDAADPVSIADMAIMFRAMAKEVCHREKLLASFMTKPATERIRQRLAHSSINRRRQRQGSVRSERARGANATRQRLDSRSAASCRSIMHCDNTNGEWLQTLLGLSVGAKSHRMGARQSWSHVARSVRAWTVLKSNRKPGG